MLKSRVAVVPLLVLALVTATSFQPLAVFARNPRTSHFQNKFVGRWTSQIKFSNGQVADDGVFDVSEINEPNADEVSVTHSVRGGPVVGHTMGYPDRIEIQYSLDDGRVAHYNGVLVSATKIEGKYFVTGRPQSHHVAKKIVLLGEGGDWTAQAGST